MQSSIKRCPRGNADNYKCCSRCLYEPIWYITPYVGVLCMASSKDLGVVGCAGSESVRGAVDCAGRGSVMGAVDCAGRGV